MLIKPFSRDLELSLHNRLLEGDPVAPSELATTFLKPLCSSLRARHPELNDDCLVIDAVTDAILNYIERPITYQPRKSSLFSYLLMSSNGDLLNALDKRGRINKKEISYELVVNCEDDRNILKKHLQSLGKLDNYPIENDGQGYLEKIISQFKENIDKKIIQLIAIGEKQTKPYAELLGITNLPKEIQQKIVKKHKDRIKKKLKRLGEKFNEKQSSNQDSVQ